jgi:hypothetical protein
VTRDKGRAWRWGLRIDGGEVPEDEVGVSVCCSFMRFEVLMVDLKMVLLRLFWSMMIKV